MGALERDEKDRDLRLRLRVVGNAVRFFLDQAKKPATESSNPDEVQGAGEVIGTVLNELVDWCAEKGYAA